VGGDAGRLELFLGVLQFRGAAGEGRRQQKQQGQAKGARSHGEDLRRNRRGSERRGVSPPVLTGGSPRAAHPFRRILFYRAPRRTSSTWTVPLRAGLRPWRKRLTSGECGRASTGLWAIASPSRGGAFFAPGCSDGGAGRRSAPMYWVSLRRCS